MSAGDDRRSLVGTLKSLLSRSPAALEAARKTRRAAHKARHWFAEEVILKVNLREQARRRLAIASGERRQISQWRQSGRRIPPPDVYKQMTVASYGRAFDLTTLVETGTYIGDMVEAQRQRFRKVISIELSPELCLAAQERFAPARNVTILQGDSGELIESVVERIGGPAIFWLDGHYSEGNTARGSLETPVRRELEVVLASPHDHVVLIDDARCFGTGDYPTLEDTRALVARLRPDWACLVRDDIIRIYPAGSPKPHRRRRRSPRRWLPWRYFQPSLALK